ncbi:hypothetical protein AB0C29_06170 [Actinoplanes sp. NPDC048791]|uniref:Rv1733c family protein n=1 Tax=Actinoplanes sp. NPDC048791 TaxID=3154623 RepID=UPI00340FF34A
MWGRRMVSQLPWRRVPLRRGSDTIQVWLTLAVIVAAFLVVPWVAWWTASTTYGTEQRANEWAAGHSYAATAVLVRDATTARPAAGDPELPGPEHVLVPARWTGPGGGVVVGRIPVEVGTRAGTTVAVWIDEHGALTSPPRRHNPVLNASAAATVAVSVVVVLLAGVRRAVVCHLDHRRLRSWDAEWQIVGPGWSRR